jgi:hypothetical protein
MTTNETTASGLHPNAARDSNPATPRRIPENDSQSNSTRRWRGPATWRSLSALVRHGLLETFPNIGGAA